MIFEDTIRYSIILAFSGLLAWAVVSDFLYLTIPNRIPVLLAVLFAARVLADAGQVDWIGGLLVGTAVFAVGVALFSFRLMGGGDVKLMSAIALWAGPQNIFAFLVFTGVAGGVLSLLSLTRWRTVAAYTLRVVAGRDFTDVADDRQIPYGAAIAAGGAYVALALWGG